MEEQATFLTLRHDRGGGVWTPSQSPLLLVAEKKERLFESSSKIKRDISTRFSLYGILVFVPNLPPAGKTAVTASVVPPTWRLRGWATPLVGSRGVDKETLLARRGPSASARGGDCCPVSPRRRSSASASRAQARSASCTEAAHALNGMILTSLRVRHDIGTIYDVDGPFPCAVYTKHTIKNHLIEKRY